MAEKNEERRGRVGRGGGRQQVADDMVEERRAAARGEVWRICTATPLPSAIMSRLLF